MEADLARVLAATVRRMRTQRALAWSAHALAAGGVALALLHGVCRLVALDLTAGTTLLALLAVTATGGLAGASRAVSRDRAAGALDQTGGLEGRVRAAVAFTALPADERTPFMEAALRDAARHVSHASAARAAPISLPRAIFPALLALVVCLVVTPWPATRREAGPLEVVNEAPLLLSPDELTALRNAVSVSGAVEDPARAALAALLDDLAARRLTREVALTRVARITAALNARRANERELATFQALSDALSTSRSASAVADALEERAAQLRDHRIDRNERTRLAQALDDARAREAERAQRASTSSERREPSLLPRDEPTSPRADSSRTSDTERHLERLTRALAQAASALRGQDDGQAADALEQTAKSLQKREQDEATRRALSAETDLLRERLQRPPEDPARSERFERRARGAEDQAADGGPAYEARALQPADGDGGADAQVTQATRMEIPETRSRQVERERTSLGGSAEHDATQLAAPTRTRGPLEDHRLEGARSSGPSRSQVIGRAASAGFASAPYREVYGDYRAHAEAVLERDQVPDALRYAVRRYFQLVRPREPTRSP